jgi:hypothetical protein
MSTNTKHINIQISGDQDAVDAALVFDRPEVYRPASFAELHQRRRLESGHS